MAPIFVLLEIVFMLGLKKKLHKVTHPPTHLRFTAAHSNRLLSLHPTIDAAAHSNRLLFLYSPTHPPTHFLQSIQTKVAVELTTYRATKGIIQTHPPTYPPTHIYSPSKQK